MLAECPTKAEDQFWQNKNKLNLHFFMALRRVAFPYLGEHLAAVHFVCLIEVAGSCCLHQTLAGISRFPPINSLNSMATCDVPRRWTNELPLIHFEIKILLTFQVQIFKGLIALERVRNSKFKIIVSICKWTLHRAAV